MPRGLEVAVFPILEKGDRVALVCLSSPINQEKIGLCTQVLEELGYQVVLGESLYWNKGGFKAGEAKDRAQELHKFFGDDSIKAIFCARGGDSALEVLQYLDRDLLAANPKVFLGYSDITNYHIFLNQFCGLISFHGPMVYSDMIRGFDDYSRISLEKSLAGQAYELENPQDEEIVAIVSGSARGRLVGGNLSLICAGLGGSFEIDTRGKILFIEDINESVEHLHRMLWQLSYAGKFDDVVGVILGDFNNCVNIHDEGFDQDALFDDFFKDFKVPVIKNLKSGHCWPMASLVLGANYSIQDNKIKVFD